MLTSTTGSLLVVIPPVTPIFPSGPRDIVSCNVRLAPENSIQYRSRLATARIYFPIFRNQTGLCFNNQNILTLKKCKFCLNKVYCVTTISKYTTLRMNMLGKLQRSKTNSKLHIPHAYTSIPV